MKFRIRIKDIQSKYVWINDFIAKDEETAINAAVETYKDLHEQYEKNDLLIETVPPTIEHLRFVSASVGHLIVNRNKTFEEVMQETKAAVMAARSMCRAVLDNVNMEKLRAKIFYKNDFYIYSCDGSSERFYKNFMVVDLKKFEWLLDELERIL